jgi:hypothetical protein
MPKMSQHLKQQHPKSVKIKIKSLMSGYLINDAVETICKMEMPLVNKKGGSDDVQLFQIIYLNIFAKKDKSDS